MPAPCSPVSWGNRSRTPAGASGQDPEQQAPDEVLSSPRPPCGQACGTLVLYQPNAGAQPGGRALRGSPLPPSHAPELPGVPVCGRDCGASRWTLGGRETAARGARPFLSVRAFPSWCLRPQVANQPWVRPSLQLWSHVLGSAN